MVVCVCAHRQDCVATKATVVTVSCVRMSFMSDKCDCVFRWKHVNKVAQFSSDFDGRDTLGMCGGHDDFKV